MIFSTMYCGLVPLTLLASFAVLFAISKKADILKYLTADIFYENIKIGSVKSCQKLINVSRPG